MTTLDAMKQALEAWDTYDGGTLDHPLSGAMEALRTAIERMERAEPVGCVRALTDQCAALIHERDELQKQVWRYEKHGVTCQTYRHWVESSCSECNVHENYTTPPAAQPAERKPLTEEQVWGAYMEISAEFDCNVVDLVDFARAIEAANGIKEQP